MSIQHPRRILLAALILAWLVDFLFWQKNPGVSFQIIVVLCTAAGLWLCLGENRRPAAISLVLLLPILFFSTYAWLRREPFTLFVDRLLVFCCLAVLAVTLLGGKWAEYNLADYVTRIFGLAGSALTRTGGLLLEMRRSKPGSAQPDPSPSAKQFLPVLRGLLLAAPVVAVLAALLAAADPIFSLQMRGIIDLLKIELLPEYLLRAFYILVIAYVLAGIYLHSLAASQDTKVYAEGKSWLPPFLGWIEAAIVLASVDFLFAFFVAIQARYFFGGQANITTSGYTYAEYARRGFGELIAVVLISLLLLLGLSAITRRDTILQRWGFSGLGIGLVGLVSVILVSAYQRLFLYESAYGFSRIRTYTHIFMAWIGILLLAVILLEVSGRQRSFALAAFVVALGFGVSLSLVNVDAFIVQQNVLRAQAGQDLDMAYLAALSEDAFPALISAHTNPALPVKIRDQAAGAITCHNWLASEPAGQPAASPWQSYNASQALARQLVLNFQEDLQKYEPAPNGAGVLAVKIHGAEYPCVSPGRTAD